MTQQKKLIEVALPLDAISTACRADKNRKTGTIRNLHKWFAPMPSPAWRALLFAALVDWPDDEVEAQALLEFVRQLVPDDGRPPSDEVLRRADERIREAGVDPLILDPFCGGGQRSLKRSASALGRRDRI